MELSKDFVFKAHRDTVKLAALLPPTDASRLGPLAALLGTWKGQGFNQIWRPFHATPPVPSSQDRFLELNLTDETLQFEDIPGAIPNRGLLQEDIDLFGMTYLQQVQDHNTGEGIHVETGIWLHVPATTQPQDASTVVRMGSIPHGTTIEAQGIANSTTGAPTIDAVDITPFLIGQPKERIPFPESNLAVPSEFRTPSSQLTGITQEMVDNPNVVLSTALQGQTVVRTSTLRVSSRVGAVAAPSSGGGVANIAFLTGNPTPNARSAQIDAVFWIEVMTDASGETFEQLQYTQTVLLDFNGLSWPHVSAATLRRVQT